MADNSRKTPLARSLVAASEKVVREAIEILGKALPASIVSIDGAIATVKFEIDSGKFTLPQVELPIAGSEYVRLPIQVGAKGVVFPADVRLGGVSGLAPGLIPKLDAPANLAALVFFPIGNADWFSVDPNVLVLYGPEGVTLQKQDGSVKVELTNDGDIILTPAMGRKVIINSDLEATGEITAKAGTVASVTLSEHKHSGVTTGGAQTQVPVPGT